VFKSAAVVIPVLTLIEPTLELVKTAFGIVAVVAVKFAALISPVAKSAEVVIPVLTLIEPALIFVSNKFVLVIFTVVKVPPTTKFPDKLKFPPVIVVPIKVSAEIVVLDIFVIDALAELTFVLTIFGIVAVVAAKLAALISPVAKSAEVVIPVAALSVPALIFVAVAFARADNPVALIVPTLALVAVTFAREAVPLAFIVPTLAFVPTIFVATTEPLV
jgi:hypothetical protein